MARRRSDRDHFRKLQNAFGSPACFRVPLAVCLDFDWRSTVKCRREIGLYQTSWSPRPMRTRVHW